MSPAPHAVSTLPAGAPQVTTTVVEPRSRTYSPVIKTVRKSLELRTGGSFSIAAIGYIRVSISTLLLEVGPDSMHVCREHVFCLVVNTRNFSPHTRCCPEVVVNCPRTLYLYASKCRNASIVPACSITPSDNWLSTPNVPHPPCRTGNLYEKPHSR